MILIISTDFDLLSKAHFGKIHLHEKQKLEIHPFLDSG